MQCVLMRRLVEDLNLPPEIVICPTSKWGLPSPEIG